MWVHLGMVECRVLFMGQCEIDLDLTLFIELASSLVHISYILGGNNFKFGV